LTLLIPRRRILARAGKSGAGPSRAGGPKQRRSKQCLSAARFL